jgi:acyl carrier protein
VNETTSAVYEGVKDILVTTLDLEDQRDTLTPDTELLGALPGLDSMSVMLLIAALAERFEFDVEDVEISGETFETVGTLTTFVESVANRA